MEMTDVKVCPIMSIRAHGVGCIESECALWLAGPEKCSLVFLGYKAMLDVQLMQRGTQKQ